MSKVSKANANYQSHPRGRELCAGCFMFRSPDGCSYVEGEISPDGWCKYYERADRGKVAGALLSK